ncbi:MAG: amino acid permease [Lentisphaeria bacterium]|nr:amino acid permease [Lentisphaeria bacterium]
MTLTQTKKGYQFSTFSGVFLPSILTILGVVMFMRLGTIVGELGVIGALGILFFAESIAVATGLSISSISTNTPVLSGGPYFLISRSLGPEFGSSIGLTYYVSQSLAVPFYVIGFTEAVVTVFPALDPYQFWVSTIPLIILFGIAMIGTDWAIRAQYVIFTILGLSIVVIVLAAVFSGPSAEQLHTNLKVLPGKRFDILILASWFAVFFPAVTGFLAGVNMSGDLEDARKSISKGTLWAITAGFIIYAVEIVLFGATWERHALVKSAYDVLVKNAHFAWVLIFAGMVAATLSSALGTLIGAPRILQAFAADKILPPLNVFAKGRGKNNDPLLAMTLTLILSLGTIWWGTQSPGNTLNAVAELVTMFTLCTYAIINIAAAVEHFAANPSFRPKFHLFHWTVGCYGAIACFAAALFINALCFLAAFVVVAGLFLIVRRRALASTFGDARRGYYFERIRRYLLRLDSMPADAKNWRPQILILAGADKKHQSLIRYGSLLNNERGILTVARIMAVAAEEGSVAQKRRRTFQEMRTMSAEIGIDFFPQVIATTEEGEFDRALNILLQSHSFGPLAPNIVLSGWPVNQERVEAFCSNLLTIQRLKMNSLLLINPSNGEEIESAPLQGPIDIWWRGRKNGSLMLILAHLLVCNRSWAKTPIRLIRMAPADQRAEAEQELQALSEEARIDAQNLVVTDERDFTTAFRKHSADSSVIFLGFIPPRPGEFQEFYDRIDRQLTDMPTTFLVASAGDTDIDS